MNHFALFHRPQALCASLATAVALLLPASHARAQAPPPGLSVDAPAVDTAAVDRLVADLQNDDFRTRKAAHEGLIDLGQPILPALSDRFDSAPTVHLRTSLDLAIEEIRQEHVAVGQVVRLRCDNARAGDVLRQIGQQTGIPLDFGQINLETPVTGDFHGWTWWQTIGHLCHEFNWDLRVTSGGFQLVDVGNSPTLRGRAEVVGPLAVLPRNTCYERSMTLSRGPGFPWPTPATDTAPQTDREGDRAGKFEYAFEAYLEPRFLVGTLDFQVLWTHATDDHGNTLLPGGSADLAGLADDVLAGIGPTPSPEARSALNNLSDARFSAGRLRFSAPLLYPRDPGARLTLGGRLLATVGAQLVDLSADAADLETGVRWIVAGEEVIATLEAGRSPDRVVLVYQTLRDPGEETLDIMVSGFSDSRLLDDQGQRLRRGTASRQFLPGGGMEYRIEFIANDADRPLVVGSVEATLPRRLVELDLPFHFEDLPMP